MESEQNSINIKQKRISINNDPNRVIIFDPTDILFAEKFYRLAGEFEEQQGKYEKQMRELGSDHRVDQHGIPLNFLQRIEVAKTACQFMRDQIDILFGSGTSQMVFGNALSLDAISQFFTGIKPYIQQARREKVSKYTKQQNGHVMK